jgi:aldehyde dehydrogenase (NAD+)
MEATTTAPESQLHLNSLFDKQRAYFLSNPNPPLSARLEDLMKLENWIIAHRKDIQEAVFKDFRKPPEEMDLTEIYAVLADIRFNRKHLKEWMRPEKVATPLTLLGTRSWVAYEPKGVTLIIAPWNYPFQLVISPLISALAAGNTAVLKPSEMTPHVADLVSKMCNTLFPEAQVACVLGAVETARHLLELPFDHIFFTGSPAIGKQVMQAASRHLTSVTLELGGKSPTVVDQSAHLKEAAQKIAFSKFLNNGQTCIAPDYVLVHEEVEEEFTKYLIEAIQAMFGSDYDQIKQSDAYARIVNERHYFRIVELLNDAVEDGAHPIFGGIPEVTERFIPPSLLTNVPLEARIWDEEIFGPVLPIRSFRDLKEVAQFIRSKPKPLAQYIFTRNKQTKEYLLSQTSAGGVCINDCLLHFMNHELPFGGVNNSGIGKSHGKYGFLEFSNAKAVLNQRIGNPALKPLYPPYTDMSRKLINWLMKFF